MKSSYDMFLRRGMAVHQRNTAPSRPVIIRPSPRQIALSANPRAYAGLIRDQQEKERSRQYQDAIHYRDSDYKDDPPAWARRAVSPEPIPVSDPSANIRANTRIRLAKAKSSLKKTLQYRRNQK